MSNNESNPATVFKNYLDSLETDIGYATAGSTARLINSSLHFLEIAADIDEETFITIFNNHLDSLTESSDLETIGSFVSFHNVFVSVLDSASEILSGSYEGMTRSFKITPPSKVPSIEKFITLIDGIDKNKFFYKPNLTLYVSAVKEYNQNIKALSATVSKLTSQIDILKSGLKDNTASILTIISIFTGAIFAFVGFFQTSNIFLSESISENLTATILASLLLGFILFTILSILIFTALTIAKTNEKLLKIVGLSILTLGIAYIILIGICLDKLLLSV